jgi:hypothetical protein
MTADTIIFFFVLCIFLVAIPVALVLIAALILNALEKWGKK